MSIIVIVMIACNMRLTDISSSEPTGDTVLSNLSILHQVHYWQHSSADAGWEDGLGRLQHVVGGRVLCGVFLV